MYNYDSGKAWQDLLSVHGVGALNYPADFWVVSNLKHLNNSDMGFVCDAACGFGRHITHLARRGWRTVGIDFSHEALRYAKHKVAEEGLASSCFFVRGDLHSLFFSKCSLKAGVCVDLLSIVDDPRKVLTSLSKICTHNARFLVTFQSEKDETFGGGEFVEDNLLGVLRYAFGGAKYRFFSEKSVLSLVRQGGWEIIDMAEYEREDPPHSHREVPHVHHYFGCLIKLL